MNKLKTKPSIVCRFKVAHNVGHMSSGGFISETLSTEAETTIEVMPLVTHKPRHYLYAVLPPVLFFFFYRVYSI